MAAKKTAGEKPPGSAVATGRPTMFSESVADAILDGLVDGKSLVEICESNSMPNRRTVLRWMEKDQTFAASIARAREEQGEYMDHLVLQEANGCTPENAQAVRVKIAAYQWRAAKLKPKSFGEKLDVTQTTRVEPVSAEQMENEIKQSPALRREIERMLAKATPDES